MTISVLPPASSSSGAASNDFTVNVGTSGYTNVQLATSFPAGSYIATSTLNDTTLDIYLIASDGSSAGYANSATASTTVTASKPFNKVVIYGSTNNDTLTFQFKYVFSPSDAADNTSAAARILSLTPSSLPNQNNTTTITGQNFATDIQVTFTGTDNTARSAKTIVRNSSTSLTVTRPDNMPPAYSPYAVTVINPGIAAPTTTNSHILSSAVTVGAVPVWVTGSQIDPAYYNQSYSYQLSATDSDGGSNVTYSIVSGTLPTGITMSSSGLISGTSTLTTGSGRALTIRATDSGGNYVDLNTNLPYATATGGTITSGGGYIFHTFNANGTYTPLLSQTGVSSIAVGGGGGAGGSGSGGGGGGGVARGTNLSLLAQNYSVVVGGSGGTSSFNGGSATGGAGAGSGTGGASGSPQSNAGASCGTGYGGTGGGAGEAGGCSGSGGAGYVFESVQYTNMYSSTWQYGSAGLGSGGQIGSNNGGGFYGPGSSGLNRGCGGPSCGYNWRGADGEPNSGGGGGGGYSGATGGNGGSGTVIIRY
jgi:hypothetical protein